MFKAKIFFWDKKNFLDNFSELKLNKLTAENIKTSK